VTIEREQYNYAGEGLKERDNMVLSISQGD
jgi:hypothetical protein